MTTGRTAIIGAGDYGVVYLRYLREVLDANVVAFFDDDNAKHGIEIAGVPVVGPVSEIESVRPRIDAAFVPIGNNAVRLRLVRKLKGIGVRTPNFVHPSVQLASSLSDGQAIYILPGSIVMPGVRFGQAVMLSTGVKVAHHTMLEDGVFLSQGSSVGANITVQSKAFIGMESAVVTGVETVGAESMVGAGAVVLSDVEPGTTVVGIPARPLKKAR